MRPAAHPTKAVARRGRLCLAVAATLLAAGSAEAAARSVPRAAQQGSQAAGDSAARVVTGRIVRAAGGAVRGLPGKWVVLHRLGRDTAAPLDSARTARDGGFAFRYRTTGSADALYFVSAVHHGIAYFSPPLRQPRVDGRDAEITVYDTTSRPLALRVRGRHVVVSAPQVDGSREVIEVYELSNDSSVTIVSADGTAATWSATPPSGAADFKVGESDVTAEAVRFENGRVVAVAPFAPGLKQISYAYRVDATSFPISLPVERATEVLEVLLEEPGAEVDGARLADASPVSVDGRTFRRYLAQDVPANAVLRVRVPPPASRRSLQAAAIATALGAAMLMALAASFALRRRRPIAAALAARAARR